MVNDMKNKNLLKIISDFFNSAKKYWKTPPEGRYMPYKEIFSLATGGIGVRMIVYCFGQLIISTGNSLLGNTIGIDPMPLQIIYMISLLTAVPLTAVRAHMIDNTKSMKGKYRPYIITMGLPTVILGSLFLWMPYENMSLFMKCAVVLGFNIAFQFFYSFFNESYDSLINVLSPDSIERSDVLSIRYIVENISPSIFGIVFPILAKLITGENTLYDIKIYRYLYPPMMLFGFLVSMLVYFNTNEKIVQAKTHHIQISFFDAFRAVARNKYFWIISLAGWIGFLEVGFHKTMEWMYNYQEACSAAQYSVITAIAGNASFWPNLVGPLLIRKYGKKKILVWTNLLSVVFILAMLPVVYQAGKPYAIWVLLIFTFINQFITSLGHLLGPGVNADIRDYQHYISGERIDGMFSAVGLIGNAITMLTGLVLPAIYDKTGLNTEVAKSLGYDGSVVYEVLYDRGYFVRICSVLIIASAIGAALNALPYFFYDFTETKQKAVVNVLKIRAAFEDFAKSKVPNDALDEALSIIRDSKEYIAGVGAESKEKIETSQFVMDELYKYNTPEGVAQLDECRQLTANGPLSFLDVALPDKSLIKLIKPTNEIQSNFKRDALVRDENIKAAKRALKRDFKSGFVEFDVTALEKLYEYENRIQADFDNCSKQIKMSKNHKEIKVLKDRLMLIKVEKRKISQLIKSTQKEYSSYYRVMKPYNDAMRIIRQSESYNYFLANEINV